MDAKVTLSFNAHIIEEAKKYAEANGLSLSRLTEILLRKAIGTSHKKSIESIPIEDWVSAVAEGPAEYTRHPSKTASRKKEFYESRK